MDTNAHFEIRGVAGEPVVPPPPLTPQEQMILALREVTGAIKELSALQREQNGTLKDLLKVTHAQAEIIGRGEQRYQEFQKAQRDELTKWATEHQLTKNRIRAAEGAISGLLGHVLEDLVDFVDRNEENLTDSDFVKTELTDRFGGLLYHAFSMHGVLKRLGTIDLQPKAKEP